MAATTELLIRDVADLHAAFGAARGHQERERAALAVSRYVRAIEEALPQHGGTWDSRMRLMRIWEDWHWLAQEHSTAHLVNPHTLPPSPRRSALCHAWSHRHWSRADFVASNGGSHWGGESVVLRGRAIVVERHQGAPCTARFSPGAIYDEMMAARTDAPARPVQLSLFALEVA